MKATEISATDPDHPVTGLGPVPEPTPYDEDRAAFSRTALARLVLSDLAAGISASGSALISTRNDADVGFGGRVSEAAVLTCLAEEFLVAAVVYERERGATWAEIGDYLELDAEAVAERFGPDIERWQEAFEQPYRLDETGRKRVHQLPGAAYNPKAAIQRLDTIASTRIFGHYDPHEVSECLDSGSAARRPGDTDTAPPGKRNL
ncbi:hypothetical protein ABH935_001933 [Catenulispora sp. GAS73]|uniref:hypothetical protein n=1 Tax=Catenulispora sp. GAS73 TaxID=3156269 RepID=UPI003516ED1C